MSGEPAPNCWGATRPFSGFWVVTVLLGLSGPLGGKVRRPLGGRVRRLESPAPLPFRNNNSKLWQKCREPTHYQDYCAYKRACNVATKEVRKARNKYKSKLAKNVRNDPKAFLKYVRNNRKAKERVGPLTKESGNVVTDDKESADILNRFFTTVYTKEDLTNMPVPRQMFFGREEDKLREVHMDMDIVRKKLIVLKPDKAPGAGGIYAVALREVAEEICQPLSVLFDRSLVDTEVPMDWKKANVTPIFKKGHRNLPENYRPVSLTSVVSKVFESLLRDSIIGFLKKHILIKESQHGFVEGRSCLTNMLLFLEKVTKYIDEGNPVDVLYLDFSKAFDRVPHKRLCSKLQAHGIG